MIKHYLYAFILLILLSGRICGDEAAPADVNGLTGQGFSVAGKPEGSPDKDGTIAEGLGPFDGVLKNTGGSFTGKNLFIHLSGLASAIPLVNSYADYDVHTFFNSNAIVGDFFWPVVATGALLPPAAGAYMYYKGKNNKDYETMAAGSAVIQSCLITYVYISVLKAVTGRANPEWETVQDMKLLSKKFEFGFGNNGIFWGWPSGHTGNTMTAVAALSAFYPEKTWLQVSGYAFAVYTAIGVSAVNRGGMHWFSDAVSASIISYAIGHQVGKDFRERYEGNKPPEKSAFSITPYPSPETPGLNLIYEF